MLKKIRDFSSAPTILPSRVRIPITPSMLLSIIVKFVLICHVKRMEINKKEGGFGPFFKKNIVDFLMYPNLVELWGCGCDQVVSMLAFNSDDPSSKPTFTIAFEKNENNPKKFLVS